MSQRRASQMGLAVVEMDGGRGTGERQKRREAFTAIKLALRVCVIMVRLMHVCMLDQYKLGFRPSGEELDKPAKTSLPHPSQQGVGQSQYTLPVNVREEKAFRGQDGSDVDGDSPIWTLRDGDKVHAQFTIPVALCVADSHTLPSILVATGAAQDERGRGKTRSFHQLVYHK